MSRAPHPEEAVGQRSANSVHLRRGWLLDLRGVPVDDLTACACLGVSLICDPAVSRNGAGNARLSTRPRAPGHVALQEHLQELACSDRDDATGEMLFTGLDRFDSPQQLRYLAER